DPEGARPLDLVEHPTGVALDVPDSDVQLGQADPELPHATLRAKYSKSALTNLGTLPIMWAPWPTSRLSAVRISTRRSRPVPRAAPAPSAADSLWCRGTFGAIVSAMSGVAGCAPPARRTRTCPRKNRPDGVRPWPPRRCRRHGPRDVIP